MIDEQISQHECIGCEPGKFCGDCRRLLTAIYEIGLECIGAHEKPSWDITPDGQGKIFEKDGELWHQAIKPKKTIVHSEAEKARNELRASQRKAWAKACGVAEK